MPFTDEQLDDIIKACDHLALQRTQARSRWSELSAVLQAAGAHVRTASSADDALRMLDAEESDVVTTIASLAKRLRVTDDTDVSDSASS